jgi:hypothetical protein
VQNASTADATGFTITDTVPASTTFVSADSGGSLVGDQVRRMGKAVGAGSSLTVRFIVQVTGPSDVDSITDNDYGVRRADVPTPVTDAAVTTWRHQPPHPSTPGG